MDFEPLARFDIWCCWVFEKERLTCPIVSNPAGARLGLFYLQQILLCAKSQNSIGETDQVVRQIIDLNPLLVAPAAIWKSER